MFYTRTHVASWGLTRRHPSRKSCTRPKAHGRAGGDLLGPGEPRMAQLRDIDIDLDVDMWLENTEASMT